MCVFSLLCVSPWFVSMSQTVAEVTMNIIAPSDDESRDSDVDTNEILPTPPSSQPKSK